MRIKFAVIFDFPTVAEKIRGQRKNVQCQVLFVRLFVICHSHISCVVLLVKSPCWSMCSKVVPSAFEAVRKKGVV